MTVQLVATVLAAASEPEHAESTVNPWVYGAGAMCVFLLLLLVVTRLNLDR
jgi:hypothetical protein